MEDISFSDITEEFAESFKTFMKSTANRKSGYINKCITWLSRLIYIAIDQEVIRSIPLEDVRYEKKEPAKHRYVSKQDLKRIMETPMADLRLELVRRAFIFSCWTGLILMHIWLFINQLQTPPKKIGNDVETTEAHHSASIFNISNNCCKYNKN